MIRKVFPGWLYAIQLPHGAIQRLAGNHNRLPLSAFSAPVSFFTVYLPKWPFFQSLDVDHIEMITGAGEGQVHDSIIQ